MAEQVDLVHRIELGGLDQAGPGERAERLRHGGDAHRGRAFVEHRIEQRERALVEQVASPRVEREEAEARDREAASRTGSRTDFGADQLAQQRRQGRDDEHAPDPQVGQVRNVEAIPVLRKRQQKADAVRVHPIEQRMRGDARE